MAINMLADQPSFARTGLPMADGGNSGFSSGFQSELHGLPLPEDEQLWGLSPMSPTMPSWNGKPDQGFGNPNLERDLKNAHVRNGQPTPPPFDERRSSQSMYPPLPQYQLGATSPPTFPDRSHHRSLSEQSAFDEDPSYSPDMSSGSNTKVRRRKHRDSAVSKSSSMSVGGSGQGGKRERFLERNRLAASKCRQKKKENTQQLELRYKEQSDKKELLVTEIARLRSEILGLKNEVLRHAQCGDEPIKLHLAQMVKKITYHDNGTAAPELSDAADAVSTTPEDPPTPTAQQQRRHNQSQQQQQQQQQPPQQQQHQQGTMSFGFDDALQIEPAAAASLAQQIRRESESSQASQGSCTFAPTDDNFDDLINV